MKNLFVLILVVFALFSCRKETTMWHSDWVLPLVNDTLDLQNLTNDSTLAIQNGKYILDLTREIAHIKPSEYVKIPDTLIEQKFSIGITSLNIPAGTSFVNNNKDHIFDLGETQLKQIRVKGGTITLEVFNPVETKTFFQINLPSVTKNNQPISRTVEVPAGSATNPSSASVEIDLASYMIDLTGSSGNSFNALQSSLLVSTDANGSSVILHSTDSTKFKINMQNIELDYARGYFGHINYSDSYTFESNFLKNQVSGILDIPNLTLDLDFENSIKVSAKANLMELNNINTENNNEVNLTHPIIGNPFVIETATGSWSSVVPSVKNIEFTAGNSNLEAFIENLGDKTDIAYAIELNPFGNISGGWDEFFPNSSFDVIVHAQMPLDIAMDKLTLSDTFAVNFTQDKAKTHIESGNLFLKIENTFPFEGKLKLHFYDENSNLIHTIDDINTIQSANYGSLNSLAILSQKSELTIALPQELVEKLNDVKKIRTSLELNTPNATTNLPEVISIPEKAFFKIKIQSSFKLENHIGE
jgi:hypothetical protein